MYVCIYINKIKGDGNDRSQTGFKLIGALLNPRRRYRRDDRHSRLNWPSCAASHFPTTAAAAAPPPLLPLLVLPLSTPKREVKKCASAPQQWEEDEGGALLQKRI